MKKLFQKLAFSIVCFSIMIGMFSLFGTASEGGTIGSLEVPPEDSRPKVAYVSVYTENMGKKIKLEDKSRFLFTVGLRHEERTQKKDVLLRVTSNMYPSESIFGDPLPISAHRKYIYAEDPEPVYVYVNYASTFTPFPHQSYTTASLYKIYEQGTKDFGYLSNPREKDSYGRSAYLLNFYVDLSRLALVEEVTNGAFSAYATVGYDLDFDDQGTGYDGIAFVTDGEYVVFARTLEAAKSILSADSENSATPPVEDPPAEEPLAEEPRGFWATFADLFDGCD